jgi:hypothetical protein
VTIFKVVEVGPDLDRMAHRHAGTTLSRSRLLYSDKGVFYNIFMSASQLLVANRGFATTGIKSGEY